MPKMQRNRAVANDRQTAEHMRLGKAYQDLEGMIGNLRDASEAMDIVAERTVLQAQSFFADMIRERFGEKSFAGYKIFVLTDEEFRALDYIVRHVGRLIQNLDEAYSAQL